MGNLIVNQKTQEFHYERISSEPILQHLSGKSCIFIVQMSDSSMRKEPQQLIYHLFLQYFITKPEFIQDQCER